MDEKTTGFVVWLTGLPASGKTSVAKAIQTQLQAQQVQTVILDSDEMRALLTPRPLFTDQERSWFYDVLTNLALHLSNSGTHVLIAATGNLRSYRQNARRLIKYFAEVYLQCPLVVCEARDSKGLYDMANRGGADFVPGVNVPYEPPFAPELIIDASRVLPKDAADSIIRRLLLGGILTRGSEQGDPVHP